MSHPPSLDPVRLGRPSASSFDTVVNCPGQWQLKRALEQQRALPEVSDAFAESGTRIHLARQTGNTLDLDEDEAALYENGLKFEAAILEKWIADFGVREYAGGPCDTPMERLWLNHPETFDPITSGQLDVQYATPDNRYVLIVDWKSFLAPHSPPAPKNWQLRLQAVLKWRDVDGIEVIRVALNRCAAKVGGNDYVDYNVSDLKNAEQAIFFHIWLAEQPGAPRRAGYHCHFCPCQAWCPEAAAYAMLPMALAHRAFPDSVEVEEMVERLSHADLLKIWHASTTITKIMNACDARLKTLSADELVNLGLELPETGRKLDPIVDVRGAFEHLKTAHAFSEDDLWKTLEMTKGKVAELLIRQLSIGKRYTAQWIATELEKFIEKKNAAPALKEIRR